MKILSTFNIPRRGLAVTCVPDRVVTMADVRAGLSLVRARGGWWEVIGVKRFCVPPKPGDTVSLLLSGDCDIIDGDDVELVEVANAKAR